MNENNNFHSVIEKWTAWQVTTVNNPHNCRNLLVVPQACPLVAHFSKITKKQLGSQTVVTHMHRVAISQTAQVPTNMSTDFITNFLKYKVNYFCIFKEYSQKNRQFVSEYWSPIVSQFQVICGTLQKKWEGSALDSNSCPSCCIVQYSH